MKKIKITKLEHAALLLQNGDQRIAIDPGSMTSPSSVERLRGVDAVLITHQHGDHFDVEILGEIGAPIWGPADVTALAKRAAIPATPLELYKRVKIAGIHVWAVAANHGPAVTSPIANFGYVLVVKKNGIDERIYISGDVAGIQAKTPAGPFVLVTVPVEGGGFVFAEREAIELLRGMEHRGYAIPVHADESPAAQQQFVKGAGEFCKAVALSVGEELEV